MKKSSNILVGALVGLILTPPLIALFFLGDSVLGLPLIPFDIFAWLTRVLPGPLVTFGIDAMVDTLILFGFDVAATAKTAEHVIAIAIVFVAGVVAVAALFALMGRIDIGRNGWIGVVFGLVLGILVTAISVGVATVTSVSPILGALWTLALFAGWGFAIGQAYDTLTAVGPPEQAAATGVASEKLRVEQISRREFLMRLGGATAAVTVVGAGLSVALRSGLSESEEATASAPPSPGSSTATGAGEDAAIAPRSEASLEPAPGTRPEITSVADHYLIDINPRPPVIDEANWRLSITGMVDNPLELTLDEIRDNYAPIDRYITLSCISNRVGGNLIGTTRWTGASLQEVLADAGVQDGAKHIEISSVDGFHETVALDLIASEPRIMLAYAWDGESLTAAHGFPLRIWIPDRYGMKQPRWIESIEVIGEDRPGYWVERGWDKQAIVKTTSVIDAVADPYEGEDGQMLVPIGGIAYSGARGISKVELRIDGGEWEAAQLRDPLSDTTWVIWRYDWPFEAGRYTFEVRCHEGDGTPQIEEVAPPRPSGATGIHSAGVSL